MFYKFSDSRFSSGYVLITLMLQSSNPVFFLGSCFYVTVNYSGHLFSRKSYLLVAVIMHCAVLSANLLEIS